MQDQGKHVWVLLGAGIFMFLMYALSETMLATGMTKVDAFGVQALIMASSFVSVALGAMDFTPKKKDPDGK